jgi:hypothetical protein
MCWPVEITEAEMAKIYKGNGVRELALFESESIFLCPRGGQYYT